MLYTYFIRLTQVCILSVVMTFAIAQPKLPQVRELSNADLTMTECAFDSGANAMVLFNGLTIEYDRDNHSMRTLIRRRVKILNRFGLDEANIFIDFNPDDEVELVEDIAGETANLKDDGTVEWTVLDKTSIFLEEIRKDRSRYRIVMPNVVAGSVFEIRYKSTLKFYPLINQVNFQEDFPVRKSSVYMEIAPGREFSYVIQKNADVQVTVTPLPKEGKIYFEMNDIPAFEFEPYMDAVQNYLHRVTFTLSAYESIMNGKREVNTTWGSVVKDLLDSYSFGMELKRNVAPKELDKLVENTSTNVQKATTIYNFVQSNVKWDGSSSLLTNDGVKETLHSKKGNSGEINLLLVNLLMHYDIDCQPMLVAERNIGKVNVEIPGRNQFNKVVAYAKLDNAGTVWIMDATQKDLPPFLPPFQLLNTIGLIVEKEEPRLIKIVRPADKFEKNITVQATVDKASGNINGQVRIERKGYARFAASERINGRSVNPIADVDDEKMENVEIIKTEKLPVLSDSVPAVTVIDYKQTMPDDTDLLYYTSNLFMGMGTNPFNSKKRFTDVNFGYPIAINQTETVKLPAGSTLKDVEPEQLVVSDDGQMKIYRKVTLVGDTLTISTSFQQGITLVPAANYEPLRLFYANLMKVLDQPVVIALGK